LRQKKIARVCIIIIFLALIRTMSEPFRLQYYSEASLTFEQVKPFLMGGIISAVGLLLMTLFLFYEKYKLIIAACILTIITLLIVKYIYLLSKKEASLFLALDISPRFLH